MIRRFCMWLWLNLSVRFFVDRFGETLGDLVMEVINDDESEC